METVRRAISFDAVGWRGATRPWNSTWPMGYAASMIELIQSDAFRDWHVGLRDEAAAARVQARIDRLALANLFAE